MIPLLLLELRRQRPMVLRMACLTIIVGVVFFLAGKRTPADFLAILIGSSLGVVLIVPMGISRDKMDGSLDFLCGLPVESHAIAASRFIAVAVLAIPWAVGVGAASFTLPVMVSLNPVGVAILTWLAMLLLGACGTALFTRFELESLLGAPVVAMVISVVLVPRVVHALIPGITQESLLRFLQQPTTPLVLATVLPAAVGIVGAVAFGIASRGFATYRPDVTHR
jgi:hypothetical protein